MKHLPAIFMAFVVPVVGTLSLLHPCTSFAASDSAESANIRVDTRGRNLVSLTITPAAQPAPASIPGASAALMVGPTLTVPSGGALQLQCIASYNDGSSEDVTGLASWTVGPDAPQGTKLFQGLFTAGTTRSVTTVKILASFVAGTGIRSASSDIMITPGLTVRIHLIPPQGPLWILNATAMVAHNDIPVDGSSPDIRWDLDEDGAFDDRSGPAITWNYSGKGSRRVAVQAQLDGETATDAVLLNLDTPIDGVPVVPPVADAFSQSLLSGAGAPVSSLPAATAKLAVVIHGLEGSGREDWVKTLCSAIQTKVPDAAVVAYDWERMADPSVFQGDGEDKTYDDLLSLRVAGKTNGMLLAERLLREKNDGALTFSTAIHLIGHSAGGFVAGECALRLTMAGFSNVQVTMLDTPLPCHEHIKKGWRTDRYASGVYGGRFEKETYSPSLDQWKAAWNALCANRLEVIETVYGADQYSSLRAQMNTGVIQINVSGPSSPLGFRVKYGMIGPPDADYRRVEIDPTSPPNDPSAAAARHSFAHEWYQATVNGSDGFQYSNLLGSVPFPEAAAAAPAAMATAFTLEAPLPPVDLDGFTHFGDAGVSGTVHTLTEGTDAGFWKSITMPIGSDSLHFRYRFTSAGDGDFLAAYWGEEEVLIIAPDTDTARAGFVDMEVDVSHLGGLTGNLVFKLVTRNAANAVAQIDQVQIHLSDDPDGDGLTNTEELALGTNAHQMDTDGDGLSDYDEVNIHHTNPLLADSDGDSAPDLLEMLAGTDPMLETSVLRPQVERLPQNQYRLHWNGIPGRTYSVIRFPELGGPVYDIIATGIPGGAAECSLTIPAHPESRVYYLLLVEP